MTNQETLSIITPGRGHINITSTIENIVLKKSISTGLCNVFLHHTSASLIICENDDPMVLSDLEQFMHRLIPDGDPLFKHIQEGPDDMPSHIRMILTQTSLTIPITEKKLALGTWQGIFLWEHRFESHQRKLTVTIIDGLHSLGNVNT
jgi:secondary thiamine-phosphate synthase enzyme